jgi:hypothetical protein
MKFLEEPVKSLMNLFIPIVLSALDYMVVPAIQWVKIERLDSPTLPRICGVGL